MAVRRSVSGCSRSSKVVECALAQCSLSHLHFFDFEQSNTARSTLDTPSNTTASSIFFQPLHAHAVGTLGAQQLFVQSIQTRTGDQSFRASHGRQGCPQPHPVPEDP